MGSWWDENFSDSESQFGGPAATVILASAKNKFDPKKVPWGKVAIGAAVVTGLIVVLGSQSVKQQDKAYGY